MPQCISRPRSGASRRPAVPSREPFPAFLEWIAGLWSNQASTSCAASLVAAMRPQLFCLGTAPNALLGVVPPSLYQTSDPHSMPAVLSLAVSAASEGMAIDVAILRKAVVRGKDAQAGLYVSSNTPQAWHVIAG